MGKKQSNILKQITGPFIIFAIVIILANALALFVFLRNYYRSAQYKEASRLAENASTRFESYDCLGWLIDYLHDNADSIDKIYGDKDAYNAKNNEFRKLHPELGDLTSITEEEAASLDAASQKLLAELCYHLLSEDFDILKRSHMPLYLYSFMIYDNKTFIFVTGTLSDEKRASDGGDLYELGTIFDYIPGSYPGIDSLLSSGKKLEGLETSKYGEDDRGVVHSFDPVYADGKIKLLVGVAYRSSEMISQIVTMMRSMMLLSAACLLLLLILAIFHIRNIVIRPIIREKIIIENYEHDKDPKVAANQLATINTRNEIERLAGSFSSMVTELDRYIDEIRTVTEEKERIGAELSVATRIQADMLPSNFEAFHDRNDFDLYARMTPAKEVGGDFYDFFMIDDDHIALVMADVSGKGVPAALFMVIAKTLIKNHAVMGRTPSSILSTVNEQLCERNNEEMFVTVWLAIIELSTGKGVAANAGHEHPALKKAGSNWELVVYRHSPAVATMEGLNFKEHDFILDPGDSLFVYTDGVTEATNAEDELFGTDRMLEALNTDKDVTCEKTLDNVKAGIDAFVKDAPQFDDITMMCFTYKGKH